ncbi:MAG: phosphomethylpyrimidine synthase ThiC, partial [Glutamicibacter sp.]
MEQIEQHPAHTLAYRESAGISVPVTQIQLADSPNGQPNEPLAVYRTSGPGSEPTQGLQPFRER